MRKHVRTLLLLLVAMLAILTVSMVWAGPRPDGRNDRDDKKGFQDHDRDDDRGRDNHKRFRNDDDWDDHDNWHRRETYSIGLWGDMPYSDTQASSGIPNLIMDMNSQNLSFTVHDGDLKAGSGIPGSLTQASCADALYTRALGYLNMLKAPAAFTPGDNDWTDCDRANNGPFNSLERLGHERTVFFSTSYTWGQHHLRQAVQGVTPGVDDTPCTGFVHGHGTMDLNGNGVDTDAGAAGHKSVPCAENRRWTYRGVTYATINIQGSCDNLCDTNPDPEEHSARLHADIAWMQETFEIAKFRDSAGVMFIIQADPGFDRTDPARAPLRDPKTLTELDANNGPLDGFQTFLVAFRTEVKAFAKPVVLVHGDSHYFRIDKPLYDDSPADAAPPSLSTAAVNPANTARLENFTRLETFGDNTFTGTFLSYATTYDNNNVHWVKVLVDPDSREVFAFQPQIVPGNRPVVSAP